MRLTLHTLIAWLDDTLTPDQVKAIGQQVAESPVAKELIERIHRVTRQRRLTVPPESGDDATDANLVASYLDNQIPPDQVAEFEKKCLTSDVHLAEVASVHQVLSMIGHKAKVPADAKERMYRLIKGREASSRLAPKAAPRPARAEAAESASHPMVDWATPSNPRRSVLERFGPYAAVAGMIAFLGWIAYRSLQTEPSSTPPAVASNARPDAKADPGVATPPDASPAVVAPPANPQPAPVPAENLAKANPPPVEPAPAPRGPAEVGSASAIQGVLLASPADATSWEPVEANAPVKVNQKLVNLAPFRNTIKLPKGEIALVDSTEVAFLPSEIAEVANFELKKGRVVLLGLSDQNLPYDVRFEGQVLGIMPRPGTSVGLERWPSLVAGTGEPAPPRLRVFVPEGQATLKVGETTKVLNGPADIPLQVSGEFGEPGRTSPAWVLDANPSAFEKEIETQFAQYFRPGRPILSDLVEAMDDPQVNVKQYAAFGLGSLGDMESVVVGLDRKDDPSFHRAVVEVLKNGLAQSGATAKAVHAALVRQYEENWAREAEQLIVGFPPEAARDEALMAHLVDDLAAAPSRGIRAMALDHLRAMTGRDSMEYDPDYPEGKGLRAWQDLLRRKELTKDAGATPKGR